MNIFQCVHKAHMYWFNSLVNTPTYVLNSYYFLGVEVLSETAEDSVFLDVILCEW